ncbi:unnamed protein product [Spirodela intermedia]|uniref:Uncharacterized protein n=2 Tax=Spirodela intermedia TaxID=51605 RepID=A0A7I8JJI7_SPIIN|nr:unnamed protein product [Spirodela intermedia]CAA6669945.1 unnamed protein product [Spirodela intermedia]CAA7406923.1 unnamed protein product [Spirodela intermedia]
MEEHLLVDSRVEDYKSLDSDLISEQVNVSIQVQNVTRRETRDGLESSKHQSWRRNLPLNPKIRCPKPLNPQVELSTR